jgi:hypothetical protein
MFVPSLSWQTDRFISVSIKSGAKDVLFSRLSYLSPWNQCRSFSANPRQPSVLSHLQQIAPALLSRFSLLCVWPEPVLVNSSCFLRSFL